MPRCGGAGGGGSFQVKVKKSYDVVREQKKRDPRVPAPAPAPARGRGGRCRGGDGGLAAAGAFEAWPPQPGRRSPRNTLERTGLHLRKYVPRHDAAPPREEVREGGRGSRSRSPGAWTRPRPFASGYATVSNVHGPAATGRRRGKHSTKCARARARRAPAAPASTSEHPPHPLCAPFGLLELHC
eukprot:gene15702-biopygen8185